MQISKMTLNDFDLIKNDLSKDYDDFWDENSLKSDLEDDSSYYLVIKNDDEIYGFIGLKIILNEAELMNIVVKKSKRGKGIGKKLLDEAIKYLKGIDVKVLRLEVNENNSIAINLYKSFGFILVGKRKKYYGAADALLFDLNL